MFKNRETNELEGYIDILAAINRKLEKENRDLKAELTYWKETGDFWKETAEYWKHVAIEFERHNRYLKRLNKRVDK